MRLTLRLQNNRYLDVDVNVEMRELTLLSPIPNLTLEQLMKIADEMHYKINLLVTGEQISPDKPVPEFDEVNKYYNHDTATALTLLLGFCNCVISEF